MGLTSLLIRIYLVRMKRAVSYLRVSSDDQVRNTSLDDQSRLCAEYIRQSGWDHVATFREEGESAKTAKRHQLSALISFCRDNRIDFVVVLDAKRLARNVEDHASIKRRLLERGSALRFVLDRFDDSPSGRFHENVVAAAAQFDNEERGARSKRGMSATVRAGGWVTLAPRGYKTVRRGRLPSLEPDEAWAHKVRGAFEAVIGGAKPKDAVRGLRIVNAHDFLRRPVFAGYNRVDGELVAGSWPAIVPFDVWALAQERMTTRTQTPRLDFWMRGMVRCACGHLFTAGYSRNHSGVRYGYYRCKACGKAHPSKKLEASFLAWLEKENAAHAESFKAVKLAAAKEIRSMVEAGADHQRKAHVESERIAKKLSALVDMKLNGDISQEEYDAKRSELMAAREQSQRDYLFGAIAESDLLAMLDDAAWILDHFTDFLGQAKHPELLLVLRALVGSTVTCKPDGTWLNQENDGLYWLESQLTDGKQEVAYLTGLRLNQFTARLRIARAIMERIPA